MRKLFIALAGLAVLTIVSCQKEIDWGSGNGSVDLLLVKVRSMTGADTTVITYDYDGSRRLIKETTVGASGSLSLDGSLTINRNSSGVITTTVQRSAVLASAGIDSILTTYYYNTSNSRYTSSVFSLSVGGFGIKDSAVYTYDGSGRIVSDLHFTSVPPLIPPFQSLQNQYTYSGDGLNLVKADQLSAQAPGDPLSVVSTQTFLFDTKTNPLLLKNEGILLARLGGYSANNSTKEDYVDSTDPTQNFTINTTFKYNLSNKPDSSYGTRNPGATLTASKYFYQ